MKSSRWRRGPQLSRSGARHCPSCGGCHRRDFPGRTRWAKFRRMDRHPDLARGGASDAVAAYCSHGVSAAGVHGAVAGRPHVAWHPRFDRGQRIAYTPRQNTGPSAPVFACPRAATRHCRRETARGGWVQHKLETVNDEASDRQAPNSTAAWAREHLGPPKSPSTSVNMAPASMASAARASCTTSACS